MSEKKQSWVHASHGSKLEVGGQLHAQVKWNSLIIHSGAKRTHFFQIIVTFLNFQYKKILLTPKQPVINAVLITYIDYSITENYIRKMASFLPYTHPEPLLKVLQHIY